MGEFWTDMSFRHVPHFSGNSGDEMNRLGRAYGTGLQLINILRDLPSDLKQGRCYLPQDQLARAGVLPSELPERADAGFVVVQTWLDHAEAGLRAGMQYVDAIKNRRIRVLRRRCRR